VTGFCRALTAALTLLLSISIQAGGFPFSLAAERAEFVVGQPIYLRIGSFNAPPPSLEEGILELSITAPDGSQSVYRPPLRLRRGPPNAGPEAEPDSTRSHVRFARLIASGDGLLFRAPGRYRLVLISPEKGGAAVSDTLGFRLKPPEADADRRAFAIITRNPGEYAMAVYLEGGDQLAQGMAIIRELAGFKSAYTRTAFFILSSNWAQDFTDYRGKGSRTLDLEKSLAMAQWDKGQGSYIPLRNAYRLVNGVQAASRRNPEAPVLREVRSRVEAFIAGLSAEESAWYRSF
jgi:hypothetical protein